MKDELKRKSRIINRAADQFTRYVTFAERRVWREIKRVLQGLDISGGVIDASDRNKGILASIADVILRAIYGTPGTPSSPPLTTGAADYIENFDKVEKLNRLIYQGFLNESEALKVGRLSFATERNFIMDQVTRGVTGRAFIQANIVQPIQDVLYRGVMFRQPLREVQERLRTEIVTQAGSNSRLLRYTRQITQDAISQFDGAINDRIRDDLGLTGFFYVGSIIKTTRQNCYDLITGSNKYADLAIEPGLYRTADLPTIIARAKRCEPHHAIPKKIDCGSGWNDQCDPETFGRYRGGYNCRHEVIYTPLSENAAPARVARAIR